MIQDPRVGITMYPGPPPPPGEKDGGQRRWDGASSDLPRKRAFCPAVVPSRHPGYGAEGLVHTPVPFAHRDVTPFSSHCLLTAVKVCEEKGSGSAQTKSWNIFLIKTHRNTFYFTTSYTNPPHSQVSQRKYILTSVVLKRARHTTLSLFCNP